VLLPEPVARGWPHLYGQRAATIAVRLMRAGTQRIMIVQAL
jgi:hypothetical protein